jgi:hypothetical protein
MGAVYRRLLKAVVRCYCGLYDLRISCMKASRLFGESAESESLGHVERQCTDFFWVILFFEITDRNE